jgi:hypothetical protein
VEGQTDQRLPLKLEKKPWCITLQIINLVRGLALPDQSVFQNCIQRLADQLLPQRQFSQETTGASVVMSFLHDCIRDNVHPLIAPPDTVNQCQPGRSWRGKEVIPLKLPILLRSNATYSQPTCLLDLTLCQSCSSRGRE